MRKRTLIATSLTIVLGGLYLHNASWPARPTGALTLYAHRGVSQPFSTEGLTNDSCTALKAIDPGHRFLENTLPSMREAFRLGADVVELDVHPTADGEFAVFHDWTVDCRTDGKGVTREKTMAELKALDAAWGYSYDGGKTFPLRGSGVGSIPTLDEVLRAFPDRRLAVNIKSDDPREADLLHAYLSARPWARPERLSVYGGPRPVERLRRLRPEMNLTSKTQAKTCFKDYLLTGWTGIMPQACRNTMIGAPSNLRWLLWGWPNRFLARAQAVGTDVYLTGEADLKAQRVAGVDGPEELRRAPRGWRGGIMTDRIDVVGPTARACVENGRCPD